MVIGLGVVGVAIVNDAFNDGSESDPHEPGASKTPFRDETQDRCLGVPGPMEGCPDNVFTLGKPKRNKHRGTATLIVTLPNPGELTAAGQWHQGLSRATCDQNESGHSWTDYGVSGVLGGMYHI